MRVCTYIVTVDSGLAPNPYWGFCTLAVCTPNHMGIKQQTGDWIIGFLSKNRRNKFLYAMKISEVKDFQDYFNERKYSKKIPNVKGSWQERCGDNFYYKNANGEWKQAKTIYHRGMTQKDTKYPRVFISDDYYYFGENAAIIPKKFSVIIPTRQGVKCNHDPLLVTDFISWLQAEFKPGIHGLPIDNKERIKANNKLKPDCISRYAPSTAC